MGLSGLLTDPSEDGWTFSAFHGAERGWRFATFPVERLEEVRKLVERVVRMKPRDRKLKVYRLEVEDDQGQD